MITKLNKACQSKEKVIFITQLHNAEISVGTLKYSAVKTHTISEKSFLLQLNVKSVVNWRFTPSAPTLTKC
jgi:hypothetical protein